MKAFGDEKFNSYIAALKFLSTISTLPQKFKDELLIITNSLLYFLLTVTSQDVPEVLILDGIETPTYEKSLLESHCCEIRNGVAVRPKQDSLFRSLNKTVVVEKIYRKQEKKRNGIVDAYKTKFNNSNLTLNNSYTLLLKLPDVSPSFSQIQQKKVQQQNLKQAS
jgi:hypothetical protein